MEQVFQTAKEKMNKTVNAMMGEFATIRVGGPTPACSTRCWWIITGPPRRSTKWPRYRFPSPSTLLITPWDKSTLKAIEKAIQTSDIGLNPQNDGSALRLNFPPLTEEAA